MLRPMLRSTCLVVALAACGKSDKSDTSKTDTSTPPKAPTAATSTLPAGVAATPNITCDRVIPVEMFEKMLPDKKIVQRSKQHTSFTAVCDFTPSGGSVEFDCATESITDEKIEKSIKVTLDTGNGLWKRLDGLERAALLFKSKMLTFWDRDVPACKVSVQLNAEHPEIKALAKAIAERLSPTGDTRE
jgi:hypothetical protein